MESVLTVLSFIFLGGGISVLFLTIMPFTSWGIRARDFRLEPAQRRTNYSIESTATETLTLFFATVVFIAAVFFDDPWVRFPLVGLYVIYTLYMAHMRHPTKNVYRKATRRRELPLIADIVIDLANTATAAGGLLTSIWLVYSFVSGSNPSDVYTDILSGQRTVEQARTTFWQAFSTNFMANFLFAHFAMGLVIQFLRFVWEQWIENGGFVAAAGSVVFYPISIASLFVAVSGQWWAILGLTMFVGVWFLFAGYFLWGDWFEAFDCLAENHMLFGLVYVLILIGTGRAQAETFWQMAQAIYGTFN